MKKGGGRKKKEHTGRERQDIARLLELDEAAERAGGLAARVRFVVREQSSDGMLGICQGLFDWKNHHPSDYSKLGKKHFSKSCKSPLFFWH